MTFRVILTDGQSNDFSTLEKAQKRAYHDIIRAATGKTSTYYEPVEIVEIDADGEVTEYDLPLGFDPVIQPDEPPCSHGKNAHHWENNGDPQIHDYGETYSRICSNCGMTEYHDTWHDDGFGGILHNWIAYGHRQW